MTVGEMFGYAVLVTIVVIFWILLALFIIRSNRREAALAAERGVPVDHVSLYFEEYFPTMMRNFDLVTKSRFDEWAASIKDRLAVTGETIKDVQAQRKRLDLRVSKLEGRLDKLEKA